MPGRTLYDAIGRVIETQSGVGTAAAASDTRVTYTPNGQIASATDAKDNRTSYEYDGHDRLTITRYPVQVAGQNASNPGDYEQLSYDPAGNVLTRRLRDGQVLGHSYDALNRRIADINPKTHVTEVDVSYTYDNLGRMTRAQDANGWYVDMGYDALGRMIRQTWNSDGLFTTYDYLVTGEVTAIRENGGLALANYSYDNLGRRTEVVRGNGTRTAYAYDSASRLSSLTQDLAGTANDVTSGFGYNPASQITSRTQSNSAYDWAGHVNTDRSYSANGLNQYTAAGAVGFGYDARGNLTSSGTQTYQYNSRNRLYGTGAGGWFYHNPAGLLSQITGIGNLDYVGTRLMTEQEGAVNRRYVWGPGVDEPIVWYEGAGTADRRWLHADERGSIVAVTNGVGEALAINSYDEYGIPGANNLGRFQYTGQKWIPSLGMYDYKARVYSPTLGRFLQTDPIGYGDGMNWYNYVGSDPVNNSDPFGLCTPTWNDILKGFKDGSMQLVGIESIQLNGCDGGDFGGGGGYGFGGGGQAGQEGQASSLGQSTEIPPQKDETPACRIVRQRADAARQRLPARVTLPNNYSDPVALRFFQATYAENSRDSSVGAKIVGAAGIPLALVQQSRAVGVLSAIGGFSLGEALSAQAARYQQVADDIQARLDQLQAQEGGQCR